MRKRQTDWDYGRKSVRERVGNEERERERGGKLEEERKKDRSISM